MFIRLLKTTQPIFFETINLFFLYHRCVIPRQQKKTINVTVSPFSACQRLHCGFFINCSNYF